jgi:hypothetical protein
MKGETFQRLESCIFVKTLNLSKINLVISGKAELVERNKTEKIMHCKL